jgi:elongation factor 1-beta
MNVKEVNGRLTNQPYVAGFHPSNEDAKLFAEMFGNNTAVVQWAAQMASYYNSERAAIVNPPKAAAPKKAAAPAKKQDDDDDMDLFGEETEEEKAAKEKKKADDKAAAEKKKKAAPIAKSTILMDIKVWEADQDLEALAKKLKSIEKDGLIWGAHKLVPIAFGVKKLQLMIVIEDDKVSSDDIEDMIVNDHEEEIQSMDIVAWNKV